MGLGQLSLREVRSRLVVGMHSCNAGEDVERRSALDDVRLVEGDGGGGAVLVEETVVEVVAAARESLALRRVPASTTRSSSIRVSIM